MLKLDKGAEDRIPGLYQAHYADSLERDKQKLGAIDMSRVELRLDDDRLTLREQDGCVSLASIGLYKTGKSTDADRSEGDAREGSIEVMLPIPLDFTTAKKYESDSTSPACFVYRIIRLHENPYYYLYQSGNTSIDKRIEEIFKHHDLKSEYKIGMRYYARSYGRMLKKRKKHLQNILAAHRNDLETRLPQYEDKRHRDTLHAQFMHDTIKYISEYLLKTYSLGDDVLEQMLTGLASHSKLITLIKPIDLTPYTGQLFYTSDAHDLYTSATQSGPYKTLYEDDCRQLEKIPLTCFGKTIISFGAGSGDKDIIVLERLLEAGQPVTYILLEQSETSMAEAKEKISTWFSGKGQSMIEGFEVLFSSDDLRSLMAGGGLSIDYVLSVDQVQTQPYQLPLILGNDQQGTTLFMTGCTFGCSGPQKGKLLSYRSDYAGGMDTLLISTFSCPQSQGEIDESIAYYNDKKNHKLVEYVFGLLAVSKEDIMCTVEYINNCIQISAIVCNSNGISIKDKKGREGHTFPHGQKFIMHISERYDGLQAQMPGSLKASKINLPGEENLIDYYDCRVAQPSSTNDREKRIADKVAFYTQLLLAYEKKIIAGLKHGYKTKPNSVPLLDYCNTQFALINDLLSMLKDPNSQLYQSELFSGWQANDVYVLLTALHSNIPHIVTSKVIKKASDLLKLNEGVGFGITGTVFASNGLQVSLTENEKTLLTKMLDDTTLPPYLLMSIELILDLHQAGTIRLLVKKNKLTILKKYGVSVGTIHTRVQNFNNAGILGLVHKRNYKIGEVLIKYIKTKYLSPSNI